MNGGLHAEVWLSESSWTFLLKQRTFFPSRQWPNANDKAFGNYWIICNKLGNVEWMCPHQGRLFREALFKETFALNHSFLGEENQHENLPGMLAQCYRLQGVMQTSIPLADCPNGDFALRPQMPKNVRRWRLRAKISDTGKRPLTSSTLWTAKPSQEMIFDGGCQLIYNAKKVAYTEQDPNAEIISLNRQRHSAQLGQYLLLCHRFQKQPGSISMFKAQIRLQCVQWGRWGLNLFKFTIVCRLPEPVLRITCSQQRELGYLRAR